MAQTTRNAGANTQFFLAGAAAYLTWKWWPESPEFFGHQMLSWGALALATAAAIGGARTYSHAIRNRRALVESRETGVNHGSAREATEAEFEARGMFAPSSGNFLGFKYGRAVFAPKDGPFSLYEAPPGSGKDIYFAVGNILHRSLLGYSDSPDARKDAVGIAKEIAQLQLPDTPGNDKNRYFSGGARRCLPVPPLLNALIDPANCTPGATFAMLNDPNQFIRVLQTIDKELEPLVEDDRIVAFLKSEARNLLARAEKNEENFGSFLEWATQVLSPYNQAGYLADYGRAPTHNIRQMCERPITAMPMVPFSHASQFESFTSILNANLLAAAKRNPRRQRIHLCCNEFLNYRFANIGSDLEVMRGLGITADFFIQSFSGLVRKYGREAAASVNDYCDVKVYAGLNSLERARYVSDMLSEATIASRDYSYRVSPDEVNISTKQLGRRLMTADEILAMPRDQAWVFVKGLRPFKVDLRHYGHVDPWKRMVGDNPLEGPALQGETLLKINYPRMADQ